MSDAGDQSCGLSPDERAAIENHFQAISNIMRQHNMVKMIGGWRVEGETRDGRKVVHKFSVGGYVKDQPKRCYLGATPYGEIDDSP